MQEIKLKKLHTSVYYNIVHNVKHKNGDTRHCMTEGELDRFLHRNHGKNGKSVSYVCKHSHELNKNGNEIAFLLHCASTPVYAQDYINGYRGQPHLYGSRPLSEFDVRVIRLLNPSDSTVDKEKYPHLGLDLDQEQEQEQEQAPDE